MNSKSGTYVLVMQSPGRQRIQVGKWGQLETEQGFYLYVGSAFGPGGVLSRVSRHCRNDKAMRWHVDYLRAHTQLNSVWFTHGVRRLEHDWAKALESSKKTFPVAAFGCSDCRCNSHLFFLARAAELPVCRRILPGTVHEWVPPPSV